MKRQIMYKLAITRRWANTERGERIIVNTLTSMAGTALALAILLIVG